VAAVVPLYQTRGTLCLCCRSSWGYFPIYQAILVNESLVGEGAPAKVGGAIKKLLEPGAYKNEKKGVGSPVAFGGPFRRLSGFFFCQTLDVEPGCILKHFTLHIVAFGVWVRI